MEQPKVLTGSGELSGGGWPRIERDAQALSQDAAGRARQLAVYDALLKDDNLTASERLKIRMARRRFEYDAVSPEAQIPQQPPDIIAARQIEEQAWFRDSKALDEEITNWSNAIDTQISGLRGRVAGDTLILRMRSAGRERIGEAHEFQNRALKIRERAPGEAAGTLELSGPQKAVADVFYQQIARHNQPSVAIGYALLVKANENPAADLVLPYFGRVKADPPGYFSGYEGAVAALASMDRQVFVLAAERYRHAVEYINDWLPKVERRLTAGLEKFEV